MSHDHLVVNYLGGGALLPRDIPKMVAANIRKRNIDGDPGPGPVLHDPGRDQGLSNGQVIKGDDIRKGDVVVVVGVAAAVQIPVIVGAVEGMKTKMLRLLSCHDR